MMNKHTLSVVAGTVVSALLLAPLARAQEAIPEAPVPPPPPQEFAPPPPQAVMPPPPAPTIIRYEERPRWGLVGAGIGVLGGTYTLSVIIGATIDSAGCNQYGCRNDNWPLYIPVVGPFIEMKNINGIPGWGVLLTLDGLAQAGGTAMLIAGLVAKKRVPVYDSRVQVLPYGGASGAGLMALGRF